MSSTYVTALGSVTFTASTDSWSEASSSQVDVIGFPGGDAVAISLGGQRETRRAFKALLSSVSAYTMLRGMRNKAGWLQVENWDSAPVNAVLERIQPDAIQTDGQVYAQVQFVLY
jgi:hypothetical protein